ncbi:MAG: ATP-binding cassette domain-containing protein [Elusimicrobia bacterium]|nr:ATP-binding cassette domain-containing protein [Elusimicrobiota bacterium]
MLSIETRALTKNFSVPEKDPGLWGSVKSLFNRRWRQVRAVDSVSIKIEEGELVGFLGANGAGKTTTLKMLSGLLTPTSGEAVVLGHVPWKRKSAFQRRFSLVMGQRTQLWWEIPALETFRLNQVIYGLSDADYKKNLGELVDLLELQDCLSVPVKKLSLGQRMRAELAAALLHKPALLLLDEPTLGLDVVMQQKVRAFIKEYNKRNKATILLTSHNMDDVVELCPRVIVIELGRLLYDGPLAQLVSRYADHKIIRAVFDREVKAADLAHLGTVVEDGGLKAVLQVPRGQVSARAAKLLQGFPVVDLTIDEVPIDDIVRRIFTHK